MIRDPSDGSVREPAPVEPTKPQAGPVINTGTSGLQTGSEKPENLARLQRSRQWLADYHAGKIKPKSEEQP
jgi:hypothetical protein